MPVNSLRITLFSLILFMLFSYPAKAAGVVGSGTPESCTEAALDGAVAGGGNISFNCGSSPYTLTVTTTKHFFASTTIDGGGLITLSGGGTTTILEMEGYQTLLTLRNLTIANGFAAPAGPYGVCRDGACGGGVRGHFRSDLTIENCRFENNVADASGLAVNVDFGGGAIYLHSGTLTVTNSVFVNNRSTNGGGGAIHLLHSNGVITDTVFDSNQSNSYGGAFYNDGMRNEDTAFTGDGSIVYKRVTFSNNKGGGQGGASFNYMYLNRRPNVSVSYDMTQFINNQVVRDAAGDALGGGLRVGNGPASITNTTFSGNKSEGHGGAIWSGGVASMNLQNVTLAHNQATGTDTSLGLGGAIKIASSGPVKMTNVTIANNSAGWTGGGLWGGTNVTLINTIIANNTAANPWGQSQNCNTTYRNGGGNLQSPQTDPDDKPCASGITFADPKLGALADNGGFTQTMALLPMSPAIDHGTETGCPIRDQRGELRNFDGDWSGEPICDSGAYEFRSFDNPAAADGAPLRNVTSTPSAILSWTGVSWAVQYGIQIAVRANFIPDSIIYSNDQVSSASLSQTIDSLDNGVYFWHIRAQSADGKWGAWSPVESFLVMVP